MPNTTKMLLPLALLLAAGLALSGCGRKGDLDPPSVAAKSQDKYGKKNRRWKTSISCLIRFCDPLTTGPQAREPF